VVFYLKQENHRKHLIYGGFFYSALGKSGAGGIRTLVQTRNKRAFYMLILLLVFEIRKETNTLILTLASLFRPGLEALPELS